jgi:hypothetical protein
MPRFRTTLAASVGTALGLYWLMTLAGVAFMLSHENKIAETILHEHLGIVISIYGRILVGYVAAGAVLAAVFHPIFPGWRAAPATFGVCLLGLLHTLTSETHLLYGKVQSAFCAVHDAVPAALRDLYRPWLVEALLGAVLVWSL